MLGGVGPQDGVRNYPFRCLRDLVKKGDRVLFWVWSRAPLVLGHE